MLFYKFRKIDNNTLDALMMQQLYLNYPRKLNDPFDSQIFPKLICNTSNPIILKIIEAFNTKNSDILKLLGENDYYKTYCLVGGHDIDNPQNEPNKNCLMWAHYADENRGICLGFDFSDIQDRFYKVKYIDFSTPFEIYLSENDFELDSLKAGLLPFKKELTDRIEEEIYTTKSINWKYENEYRYILHSDDNFLPYHQERLREVIFGIRCSIESEKKVREALQSYTNIKFYRAEKTMSHPVGLIFNECST